MFKLAKEAVTGYDIDGFEIDFIRFPFLFPADTAWAHRHVMTAFIRRLREMIAECAKARGRPLWFSARVPDTFEQAARLGVDLETWFSEGLLDMCVIGGGYSPFTTPFREIASRAAKCGIPTKAGINQNAVRVWGWQRTEQGIQPGPTPQQMLEHLRGVACRAYAHGVSGFELWNFFYEYPHYYSPDQEEGIHRLGFGFTGDIADSKSMAAKTKAYLLDGVTAGPHNLFGHVVWGGQRPLIITPATDGIGQTVTFDIGDELSGHTNVGAELWINIVDYYAEDVMEFAWNGEPLAPRDEVYRGQTVYSNREFCFNVPSGNIKHGLNEFSLYLRVRTPRLEQFVTLDFARLKIKYDEN